MLATIDSELWEPTTQPEKPPHPSPKEISQENTHQEVPNPNLPSTRKSLATSAVRTFTARNDHRWARRRTNFPRTLKTPRGFRKPNASDSVMRNVAPSVKKTPNVLKTPQPSRLRGNRRKGGRFRKRLGKVPIRKIRRMYELQIRRVNHFIMIRRFRLG